MECAEYAIFFQNIMEQIVNATSGILAIEINARNAIQVVADVAVLKRINVLLVLI